MTQLDEPNLDELREQLEEFAISLKPGTTKGKHRTGIFDTLELAKLVQALIATQIQEARIDELERTMPHTDGMRHYNTVKARLAQLRSTTNER